MRSLVKAGLLDVIEGTNGLVTWRLKTAGPSAAQSIDPVAATNHASHATQPFRSSLRTAAAAVVAAWNENPARERHDLAVAIDTLQAKLSGKSRSKAVTQPRPDTKRAAVLTLLRRPEGATVSQVAEATGWARHTVHGFLTRLKKNGIEIDVLERVRQVGAGPGLKGSYTVYRAREMS